MSKPDKSTSTSSNSPKKPSTRDGFDEMDMDMDSGLDIFRPSSSTVQDSPVVTVASRPKKTKKPQPKVKEGLYFSREISDRLDKEWKKQPKGGLSKSIIVENIIREKWGLDLLTD